MPVSPARYQMLLSWRFARSWATAFLACLGVEAAGAGLVEALFDNAFDDFGEALLAVALLLCIVVASVSSWPRPTFEKYFSIPGTMISLVVGDLFDQRGHLVIGMNDTFDTDVEALISRGSVQSQFQDREYHGRSEQLDTDLAMALQDHLPKRTENRRDRPRGKLTRYEVGTVAVIGSPQRRYFCAAYGIADNSNYIKSTIDDLWRTLSTTWAAIRVHGEDGSVAMPVLGAGLSRISNVSYSDLIRLIIISYLAHSREAAISDHLKIVMHPSDIGNVNLKEIQDFLAAQ